ncbi:MAG: hypothetical protein M1820_002215 [Bogoriella megaspora]|nr:MAG: hypothetical protein M1820_002215 [Bogoriella megaspora]
MTSNQEAPLHFTIREEPVTGLPTPDSDIDRTFDDAIKSRISSMTSTIDYSVMAPHDVSGERYESDEENREPFSTLGSPQSDQTFSPTSLLGCSPGSMVATNYVGSEPQHDMISSRRRISAVTASSISELEPEDKYPIQYTPLRNRAAFRSPACAADAIRMESGAKLQARSTKRRSEKVREEGLHGSPLCYRSSPRSRSPVALQSPRNFREESVSSRNGSPRSVRTLSRVNSPRPATAEKQLAPLVLLHVSILQPTEPEYSDELLASILPPAILQTYKTNWAILTHKLGPTVRQRGVLLRHPRQDFEAMNTMLLEALELDSVKGIFDNDGGDIDLDERRENVCRSQQVDPSGNEETCDQASEGDTDSDGTVCDTYCPTPVLSSGALRNERECSTCGRPRRLLQVPSNEVNKSFDIKFYAANGLIRAEVWDAVWREMERVDVEINVKLPRKWRATLDETLREIENDERQMQENSVVEKDRPVIHPDEVVVDSPRTQPPLVIDTVQDQTDKGKRNVSDAPEEWIRNGTNVNAGRNCRACDMTNNRKENEPNARAPTPVLKRTRNRVTSHAAKRTASCDQLFRLFDEPATPNLNSEYESTSDVPLSIVCKNYVWLLARNPRNVAVLAFGLAAFIFFTSKVNLSNDAVAVVEHKVDVPIAISPITPELLAASVSEELSERSIPLGTTTQSASSLVHSTESERTPPLTEAMDSNNMEEFPMMHGGHPDFISGEHETQAGGAQNFLNDKGSDTQIAMCRANILELPQCQAEEEPPFDFPEPRSSFFVATA